MENFPAELNEALPKAADEIPADFQQEYQDLLEEGASKTVLRRVLNRHDIHKCMTCPFHGKDIPDLRKHLRKCKDHFYGVERLNNEKADFVERCLVRHPPLAEEVQEFQDMHKHYVKFEVFEKREYENLLWLSMLQIRLRR